jgi:uncharacterized protein YacL
MGERDMNKKFRISQLRIVSIELIISILAMAICIIPVVVSAQWYFLNEIKLFAWSEYLATWTLAIYMFILFLLVEIICMFHLFGIIRRKKSLSHVLIIVMAVIIHLLIMVACFLSFKYTLGGNSIDARPLSFYVFFILFLFLAGYCTHLVLLRRSFLKNK